MRRSAHAETSTKKEDAYQLADKITSDIILGPGHTYRVRFNEDQGDSRIEKQFEEIQGVGGM